MAELQANALVFFGVTGDLAYKQIFPALQAMIQRGHLDVPVIDVAKAAWRFLESRYSRIVLMPRAQISQPSLLILARCNEVFCH
jgi:glucose-6-phosphate 1-dehydrogenase